MSVQCVQYVQMAIQYVPECVLNMSQYVPTRKTQQLADKRLSGWSGMLILLFAEMVSERKDLQSIKQMTQLFARSFVTYHRRLI